MSKAVTSDILKRELKQFGDVLRAEMKALAITLREQMRENTREIISHFNQSQSKQNEWIKDSFETINTKLDAIMSREVFVIRPQAKGNLRS